MRDSVRALAQGRRAAALALGAAVGAVVAAAACRPAEPHGLGPGQRTAGAMRPGMTLAIDERGVPGLRAPVVPLRWPDDTTACPGTQVAAAAQGDTIFAAWWRPDSAAIAQLVLARSPDAGIHWGAGFVVGAAAPRTRGCLRPPPGLAVDAVSGRVAVAFHGAVSGAAALAVAIVDAALLRPPATAAVAAGGTPRPAAVAVAHDTLVVAYESPAAADGAIWLAISSGSAHISAAPQRVSGDGAHAFAPAVAVRSGRVAVAWNEAARGADAAAAVVRIGRIGN